MADTKITALAAIGANPINVATFPIPMVDLLDNSMAASGTTKKVTVNQILGAGGTATLASATITGNLTVDTNTLFVDSANDRVGMGTVTPVAKLIVRDGSNRNLLVASDATHLGSTGIAIGSFTDNAADWAPLSLVAKTQIAFGLNGSTAMTLNSTGLLVGTANNFASSRLCVQGTAGTSTPDVTIGIPVNSSGNTNLAIGRSASTNGYIFLDAYKAGVGGTELVLNSVNGGTVLVGLSTVVAAGGCLQLKSGITFPATQVASSDANTLDDYEEGTWSPTIIASSGTPTTVTVNSATYTKIGRLVVCSFDFSIVDIGTASSSLQFSLPFTSATSASFCGAFREKATTGSMGQVFYNSATDASCLLYNNNTVWVNGYRISGNYTYFAA